jgi:hypothetical protein
MVGDVKGCFFKNKDTLKVKHGGLPLGFLDRVLYWTKPTTAVLKNDPVLKTISNLAVSDHAPVSLPSLSVFLFSHYCSTFSISIFCLTGEYFAKVRSDRWV